MTPVLRGWVSVASPIVLWMVHIVALASVTDMTCTHPGWRWVPHAVTVLLLALCVPCLVVVADLARRPAGPEVPGNGQLRFIGLLGLLLGLTSVALIVGEEIFAILVEPCR